jgi:hypothetical protein
MNFRLRSHTDFVTNWSKFRTGSLSADQVETLFETALLKLWDNARISISSVLLASVLDRVIHISSPKFNFLSSISITEDGPDFTKFRGGAAGIDKTELIKAMELVLIQTIAILGNVTNEVIVPRLYDQLSKVSLDSQSNDLKPKNGAKK